MYNRYFHKHLLPLPFCKKTRTRYIIHMCMYYDQYKIMKKYVNEEIQGTIILLSIFRFTSRLRQQLLRLIYIFGVFRHRITLPLAL